MKDQLRDIVRRNRQNEGVGLYSVCSAHPSVLDAGIRQAMQDDSVLCVESTSNQVNQFGGYTGLNPQQFAEALHLRASRIGLAKERVILGGDHLGPYPWRGEPAKAALEKARVLVRDCVLAGYTKIHLDASMGCVDDGRAQLDDELVAERAADLCKAAEEAWSELPKGSAQLAYIIGTEVPVPGGETAAGEPPHPTPVDHVRKTLDIARQAFHNRGLQAAWEQVIGLVVQPGVEFGDGVVFDYKRATAKALSENLPVSPALVFEAHSTDYQKPLALRQMVEDHFAILKVGPWLTFAYREAIFALGEIEREWLSRSKSVQLSQIREKLEEAMLRTPSHWKAYYPQEGENARLIRQFSFSDRCRYYWPEASVQSEVDLLLSNLTSAEIPLTLLSQYLPEQYGAIREGSIANKPEEIIENRIRRVLQAYSAACGNS